MSAPVAEGQVLAGKYRVERILGQGGMGVVVSAVHQQLQQRVAIKFLLPGATHDATERFIREARAAVRLKSEHVARVSDVGELEGGTPYMVMEYLDGTDLSQLVRHRGALPIEEAVTYVLHGCEAIAEAHSIGIVHRDIKPANLFLTTGADGSQTVKVLDFGISKAGQGGDAVGGTEPGLSLTQTEMMLGSPLYMAPEQMRSAKSVDHRADIWSMGALLYQLVTGTVPFNTTSLAELILMINTQDPTPPRTYRPDLPEGLEAAILSCLRRNPQERFGNMGELAQAIAPYAPEEETTRSLPRILRTLGMSVTSQMALGRSLGTASGGYRSLSPSMAGAASGNPSVPPPAGLPAEYAAGPYAATTPSGRPAPGGTSSPSLPPPAVARTAQGALTGAGTLGEAPAHGATAVGWTAAEGTGPARPSAFGKVAVAAAAVLLVAGGLFVVSKMGGSAEQPTAASQAEQSAGPEAPAVPASSQPAVTPANVVTTAAPSSAPEPTPSAEASAAPSAETPEPTAKRVESTAKAPTSTEKAKTPAPTAKTPAPTATSAPPPAQPQGSPAPQTAFERLNQRGD
ncbi:serine/threonine-protein kinase [Chondromyces crocatus]|uniref:Protein kinase n=1 Tax=Chondromyces crocatus TaxID=52 RepID=A0A0K1E710_CHOCO|nr:serine/threonine-protein kinase [Chondromyces crocatus]AKT36656.1 protein kinase [Chondromyces crocatus]